MLKRLSINNYALISSLDIEFPDGLIIVTGETGAGKSILLGAISLLLGKRADQSVFSDAARNCVVEAEFSDSTGEEMILRRVITPAGRSRSFLNDEPVTLADLTEISSKIIDIHEQHNHLLLTDADFRLSVVDHFAGNGELLAEYNKVYKECMRLSAAVAELRRRIAEADKDAEYREFQLAKLTEAAPVSGELEELEEEQKVLAHAEEIKGGVAAAYGLLNSEEDSVAVRMKEAAARLSKFASFDSRLEELAARLESCRIEVADIESELESVGDAVVVSPQRLEAVEERMSLLYGLLRKYDCANVDELIALRDELAAQADSAEGLAEELAEAEKALAAAETQRSELASQLTARRQGAVDELSAALQKSIRSLEMPHAVFSACVRERGSFGETGADVMDFMFSANGEATLRDISKVASGGELSRVMLALKGLLARYTSLPTMIFDEIDTGVSGRVADKMGQMIGEMGANMQILAITHLPQIASKGGAHYQVFKSFDADGRPVTGIRLLEGEDRVMEIARMLSGSELTPAAIENAKSLLSPAKS